MKLRNSCRSPGGTHIPGLPDFRVFRTQKPASVMVWAAVSQAGKSPLVFVPEGVKINKETYIETILEQTLKPWAKKTYGDKSWTFQQDGATSHTARVTQQWCEDNCPAFITKDQWPPSSPDLNPMDTRCGPCSRRKPALNRTRRSTISSDL